MKKAMYSLMLSEKVVEEIDRLAEKEGRGMFLSDQPFRLF